MSEPLQHYVPKFMLRRFSSGGRELASRSLNLLKFKKLPSGNPFKSSERNFQEL